MASINCKDWRREISSAATVCVNCGTQNSLASKNTTEADSNWRWFAKVSLGLFAATMLLASVPEVSANSSTNPHQKKLLGMSEGARRVLLRKVVQSSGAKCTKVTRSFYQGADDRENHIWSAACAQGDSFSITVYNDANGSTGVVDCGLLVAVSGVSCFESFSK